jgi:hypothetical protein
MEIGDLVLVLPYLQCGARYANVFMNPDMAKYRGKIYKIRDFNETKTRCSLMDYNKKEFPHMTIDWVWARCMFTPFHREQVKRTSLD